MTQRNEPLAGQSTEAREQARLLALEQSVTDLSERVDNLVDKLARLAQLVGGMGRELQGLQSQLAPAVSSNLLSPAMQQIVQLVYQGQSEEAQRQLYALPEEDLAAQPAMVAVVAAALFVERGDLELAIQALQRARELTDDPRVMQVIELLQRQMV